MNVHSVFYAFSFLFLLLSFPTWAQQKKTVKLIGADENVFEKGYIDAQRVRGNVRFVYEGTFFYCDSAHIFKNDDFDAFGNILITKPGEFSLTGAFLHVDQKAKTAYISNNVVLRDNKMTLTTNELTYKIDREIAQYYSGGRIVSSANKNVLTSKQGEYHSKIETFFFRKEVVLKNDDYTVYSDTLRYHDLKEVAYFFGPTRIVGDDTEIYCENGWYDTQKDISQFNKNAWVRSEKTILKGDSIYYNGEKKYGEVFKNVTIRDTTQNVIISGEYGIHHQQTKESTVTRNALMTQFFSNGDTLFLSSDTLRSLSDSIRGDRMFAFRKVRIFKQDIQGVCDSLVYEVTDSTLHFFKDPILWSEKNQITGDSIIVVNRNDQVDKMYVRSNAFITSESLNQKFNQIKGRNMEASFTDNELRQVYVMGNGQLIYFPEEEKKDSLDPKPPRIIGLNKGECSNIHITIRDNVVERIRLEKESNSRFTPMQLSTENDYLLEGFRWNALLRPKDKRDVIRAGPSDGMK